MKQGVLLDSNIFIRYLVGDSEPQFHKAKQIINDIEDGKSVGSVSLLVLNEVIWILDRYYEVPRDGYIPELLKVIALKGMTMLELDKDFVIGLVERLQTTKIDFTDLYLYKVSDSTGKKIISFDKDFEKLSN